MTNENAPTVPPAEPRQPLSANVPPAEPRRPLSANGVTLKFDRQTLIWLLGVAGFGAVGTAGAGGLAGILEPDQSAVIRRLEAMERNQIRICAKLDVDCEAP